MLYEVAIIERPTQKAAEDGAVEKLIFGPKAVCAPSPQTAGVLASQCMSLSECNPNLIEVLVRPFVK